jgi:hypothetical protein
VNLTRIGFTPEDADLYTSAAMILDEDRKEQKVVATVFYSSGGNIIYKHYPEYKDEELMVAGEKFIGETMNARRWKVFICKVEQP